MKKTLTILAVSVLTLAAQAQSTLTWDWSFTWWGSGSPDPGTSGTLTTQDTTTTTNGYTGYLITAMTGLVQGSAIALGDSWRTTGDSQTLPDYLLLTDGTLDPYGLNYKYSPTGASYGIHLGTWQGQGPDIFSYSSGGSPGGGLFQVVAVPEPSTIALVGMGVAGLFAVRRRK